MDTEIACILRDQMEMRRKLLDAIIDALKQLDTLDKIAPLNLDEIHKAIEAAKIEMGKS